MKPKKKTTKKVVKKTTKKTAKKRDSIFDFPIAIDPAMGKDSWGFSSMTFARPSNALSPEDMHRAIDMIQRGMRRGDEHMIDEMLKRTRMDSVTELLEVMLSLVSAFNIQVQHTPSPFGSRTVLSMRLPLGRHTQTVNGAVNVSRDDKEYARMDRHYSYHEMFMKMLDPVMLWIDIAEKAKTEMSFKEILAIENIEQRRAALRIFGEERLLDEAHAELLDEGSHSQQLYVIPESVGAFDTAAFFLKYNCPSTGRLYISGVDPSLFIETRFRMRGPGWPQTPRIMQDREWRGVCHAGWADKAMAWKFHMTPEEYSRMPKQNQA